MHQCKGSITVFLSVILVITITFTGSLIDYARIKSAEHLVLQACEAAGYSVLSGYSKTLKEEYGLMSLYQGNRIQNLETLGYRVMNENLTVNESNCWDIYQFQIESLVITPYLNFSQPEVTRKQVIEFMKYRAPVESVGTIVERLELISSMGNIIDCMNLKIRLEKNLKKIDDDFYALDDITRKLAEFKTDDANEFGWYQRYEGLLNFQASLVILNAQYDYIRLKHTEIDGNIKSIITMVQDSEYGFLGITT